MIFLFLIASLFAPTPVIALTCLEKMSQEVVDPDQANLAANQIAAGQQKIFASIYPSHFYEMNLPVIDCASTESMKLMGADIIPYLGPEFFTNAQSSGLSDNVLHFNESNSY